MRRSGPAAAAAALARAAELSPSDAARARRSVAAAAAWLDAGDITRATVLLDTAETTDQSTGGLRRDIAELQALIELRAGTPAEAVALLEAVLPDATAAEGDRDRVVQLLRLLGEAGILAGVPSVWAEIATVAQRLPAHGSDTDDTLLPLLGAFAGAPGRRRPQTGRRRPGGPRTAHRAGHAGSRGRDGLGSGPPSPGSAIAEQGRPTGQEAGSAREPGLGPAVGCHRQPGSRPLRDRRSGRRGRAPAGRRDRPAEHG
jgi:hypothetical protein